MSCSYPSGEGSHLKLLDPCESQDGRDGARVEIRDGLLFVFLSAGLSPSFPLPWLVPKISQTPPPTARQNTHALDVLPIIGLRGGLLDESALLSPFP